MFSYAYKAQIEEGVFDILALQSIDNSGQPINVHRIDVFSEEELDYELLLLKQEDLSEIQEEDNDSVVPTNMYSPKTDKMHKLILSPELKETAEERIMKYARTDNGIILDGIDGVTLGTGDAILLRVISSSETEITCNVLWQRL